MRSKAGFMGMGDFEPLSWFANGEQGAWYDPRDITTLFQDAAGTIPAQIESPVGLMLDKSGRGHHASQSVAAKRPTLSARVNMLTNTEGLATQSVTSLATSYKLKFTGTGTITLSGTATGILSAGATTFTATAGTLILTVSGLVTLADLRPTNSGALLPSYQRVNTASDYDLVGFPLYLKCNGTSSSMSTNNIDFTATDKMTVVTGLRKLSDATTQLLLETGIYANLRGFNVHTPFPAQALYSTYAMGSTQGNVTTPASYPSPISNVLTCLYNIGNIAPNEIVLKVNGSNSGSQTGSMGSGNYFNYPLYLFSRTNSTYFFNGQFYGAIIRGAFTDSNSVIEAETYMSKKTWITF